MGASFRFCPRVVALEGAPAALDACGWLERLAARERPVLLESAGGAPQRFDLCAFDPLPAPDAPPATWSELRALQARLAADGGDPPPGPFAGGFVGALAYELGPPEETLALPADPWGFPRVAGGLYVDFLVRERASGAAWLVLGDEPGDGRAPWGARRDALLAALAAPAPARAWRASGPLVRLVPPERHRERVEAVRRAIAAGEVYQANLTQRFARAGRGHPLALYRRLRALHPAPYMGYLRFDEGALLSASPELLLELERDGEGLCARTRPIKGTIARGADAASDRARAAALLASEKDLAELAMIVDLERNDLGRVARPGSVRAEGFPTLESYATVHHLAADVRARPAAGADALDVLASLFPGGSITGAPKLRSMELLAELEGEGRGLAFGALGFLGLDGRACFNLLIRSLLWRPRPVASGRPGHALRAGEVTYRVGGGITWASDAAAEERECLDKGEALARALDGDGALPAAPHAAGP